MERLVLLIENSRMTKIPDKLYSYYPLSDDERKSVIKEIFIKGILIVPIILALIFFPLIPKGLKELWYPRTFSNFLLAPLLIVVFLLLSKFLHMVSLLVMNIEWKRCDYPGANGMTGEGGTTFQFTDTIRCLAALVFYLMIASILLAIRYLYYAYQIWRWENKEAIIGFIIFAIIIAVGFLINSFL